MDSEKSGYGLYNCSLRNAYGQDFHLVELHRQGRTKYVFLKDSSLLLVVLFGVVSINPIKVGGSD